ncbi:hypothetical protein Moror_4297 [Moniliophthora roreri MCA 2997]|uniref:Uncharacterized protein n=1 Tax=Moniliophthora roreri (strain MCA 2997) TaxID=1381753 RepID=V2XCH6_MONRO|nr:hypothetical protein Moror_4297 [Moniliophthora roreri MCA 2997]
MEDIYAKLWCFTVIRSKGLHLLRPEKSWRPIVCIVVQANAKTSTPEMTYETTLGLDGQNPNQKEVFVIGQNATPDTKVSIQVIYQPPGKKKAKRMKRIPVACCTCSLGEVMLKQASQREKPEHAQLRLQAQSTSKRSKKKNDCDNQPAVLYVRVREPSHSMTEHVHVMSDDEYASSHHPASWADSCTEKTLSPPTSPIDEVYPDIEIPASATGVEIHPEDQEQAPRRRKRKRIRGFVINSDDEGLSVSCSDSSSEDEEEREQEVLWPESPSSYPESTTHERGPWLRVSWISAMLDPIIPMHSAQLERPQPEREDTLVEDQDIPLKELEGEGWGNWCWHRFEKLLCAFTVYGELCSAAKCLDSVLQSSKAQHVDGFKSTESVNSWISATVIEGGEFSRLEEEAKGRVEKVYQRLQNEWSYVGALLVALAAVDTAVFAISPDSLFAVSSVARPMVAMSSVCSGCGIACVVWFLWWYGWGSGSTFLLCSSAFILIDVYPLQSRALDINKTYVSFALAARMPAFCMVCSAVSLMAFLAVVAYDAAPVIVWVVCCGVAVGMGGQFVIWGLVKVILGIRAVVKGVAMGVRRLGRTVGFGGGAQKTDNAVGSGEKEKVPEIVVSEPPAIANVGRDSKSSRYT